MTGRTPIPQNLCHLFERFPSAAFSALTLLVGQQAGHPASKKLSGGMLAWLFVSGEEQIYIWPS